MRAEICLRYFEIGQTYFELCALYFLFAQRGVKTLPKKADKNRHGALHSLALRCVWHEKSRIHANAAFLLRICEFVTLLLLPVPACSCRYRQE